MFEVTFLMTAEGINENQVHVEVFSDYDSFSVLENNSPKVLFWKMLDAAGNTRAYSNIEVIDAGESFKQISESIKRAKKELSQELGLPPTISVHVDDIDFDEDDDDYYE